MTMTFDLFQVAVDAAQIDVLFARPTSAHDWLIGRPELLKMAEAFEVIDALSADVKPAYGVERLDHRS
jgi:hypothetical protein